MSPDPWRAYDQWEARDRTLLEAAALAREALEEKTPGWFEPNTRDGYRRYVEYGTSHPPARRFLRPALDAVLSERYRSPSPDEDTP